MKSLYCAIYQIDDQYNINEPYNLSDSNMNISVLSYIVVVQFNAKSYVIFSVSWYLTEFVLEAKNILYCL